MANEANFQIKLDDPSYVGGLLAAATTLGYLDAAQGEKKKTGRQVLAQVASNHWRLGLEFIVAQAYNYGRLLHEYSKEGNNDRR